MLLVQPMDVSFFIENHWNIASVALLFSMHVNYMLYDCDVSEIAGGAQR
jgi:hypothetical protein